MLTAAKPKPSPTPSATPTPAPKGDAADPTNGGALDWILHNPGTAAIVLVVGIIVICGATSWAWNYRLRPYYNQRGKALQPLGALVRQYRRFMFVEDKRPVLANIKPLAEKGAWLTGTRLYLILLALIPISMVTGLIPWPVVLFVLFVTVFARSKPIFAARRSIQMQMFNVANSEIRYPRGAELNPWSYVQIQNWRNLTQPGDTVITITPGFQSEDQKTRDKFERNFNGTVSEENTWNYKWESAKNRVTCKPTDFLPSLAKYPGPGEKWDEIPVGIMGDGTQAIMPFSVTPHALVCGPTGSGKSVLQRMILFHVLAHSDTWRIVGIDMKKVELTWLRKYPSVLKVATTLEEAVEVLRSVRDEMMRRYEEMEENGVNHAKDLPEPPPAILCMIDESTVLLAPEGIKSDEGKERDELHAEAQMIIGELGRLSRASMIHVVACFQRPDARFLSGETKANFDCRIAAGRMDTTPSLMVLDSEAANRLPKIKGRGMIRVGGELDTFQGYFAEGSWFDEWVAAREAGAAGVPAEVASADEAPQQGRRKGFKGLAAKAAAAAERRAAAVDDAAAMPAPAAAPSSATAPVEMTEEELEAEFAAVADLVEGYEPLPDSFTDEWVDEPAMPAPTAPQAAAYEEPVGDWFDDEPVVEQPPLPTAAPPAPVAAPRVPTAPRPAAGGFVAPGVNPLTARAPQGAPPAGGFVPSGVNPLAPPPAAAASTADEDESDGLPVRRPAGLPLAPPPAP